MVAQLLTSEAFGSLGPGCNLRPERALPLILVAWPGLSIPPVLCLFPIGTFQACGLSLTTEFPSLIYNLE